MAERARRAARSSKNRLQRPIPEAAVSTHSATAEFTPAAHRAGSATRDRSEYALGYCEAARAPSLSSGEGVLRELGLQPQRVREVAQEGCRSGEGLCLRTALAPSDWDAADGSRLVTARPAPGIGTSALMRRQRDRLGRTSAGQGHKRCLYPWAREAHGVRGGPDHANPLYSLGSGSPHALWARQLGQDWPVTTGSTSTGPAGRAVGHVEHLSSVVQDSTNQANSRLRSRGLATRPHPGHEEPFACAEDAVGAGDSRDCGVGANRVGGEHAHRAQAGSRLS